MLPPMLVKAIAHHDEQFQFQHPL
jgi:hypothetical protein